MRNRNRMTWTAQCSSSYLEQGLGRSPLRTVSVVWASTLSPKCLHGSLTFLLFFFFFKECSNGLFSTRGSAIRPSMKNVPCPIWEPYDGRIGKSRESSWKKFKVLVKIRMYCSQVHLNCVLL